MIFQDPYASLNPRKRVGQIVGDPLKLHGRRLGRRAASAGSRSCWSGSGSPRALQPLPARVLRRPAPADRDRPGAGAAAEADRRRRAGLGARRLDPGADHQPARGPPGRVRPHLRLRRPRPRRRPPRLRPDRGHVPRQDRRGLARRRALRQPDPPLHRRAAVARSRSPTRSENARARADRPRGRRAEPDRPAVGLPLPHPLPAGDRLCARSSRSWSTTATATGPPATTRSAAERARDRRGACGRRSRLSAGYRFSPPKADPPPTARAGQRVGYAGSGVGQTRLVRAPLIRGQMRHEPDHDACDANRVADENGKHDSDHDQ